MDNHVLLTLFTDRTAKDHPIEIIFSPETSGRAVFGDKYFKQAGTSTDVYLTAMGDSWDSPLYYHGKEPFAFTTSFGLKFEAMSDTATCITVVDIDPQIINGTTCCSPHGNYSIYQPVKPTTVEEYTLIVYLKKMLGVKNINPVQLPK